MTRRAAPCLVTIAVAPAARLASGQPYILQRDVETLAPGLELDGSQVVIVKVLVEDCGSTMTVLAEQWLPDRRHRSPAAVGQLGLSDG